ncbi:MAG: type I 3-dehydroquinate dehydratase, partial [Methanocalculus sp. MSAO_Arc2]|uniref:type I 3-dehydroquinate dehydratase n=1 Tax=Methanocalculus sp. MSAO_Arc2 TaxID=2293855 RepID=UPI000FF61DCB
TTPETTPETTIETKPKTIIASYHAEKMLTPDEFTACEHRLRSFGDIPKIVLAPQNNEDAITLLSCLVHAEKPICVSIMGTGYSWLRPFLLLMGSHFAYCHSGAGDAPAAGQFHIQEMKQVLSLLSHNR